MPTRMSPTGVLAIVAACLFWGTTGTAASFLPADVSPLAVGASTMGVGGLLLFAVTARRALRVLRDPVARRWVALGAVGVFVYPLAFYTGMQLAGVAVGNVVALGSGPVFAALIEWITERRPLSPRWALATALAVGGIVLLALGRAADVVGAHGASASTPLVASATPFPGLDPVTERVVGVAIALLAGAAYALYTVASGRAIREHAAAGAAGGAGAAGAAGAASAGARAAGAVGAASGGAGAASARTRGGAAAGGGAAPGGGSSGVMGAMFGLGAVLLLPVLVILGAPLLQSPTTVGIAAYLAIGPTLLAYLLFGVGLRTVPGSTATVITLLEPVLATLLAVTVVGERLSPLGWSGLALVLVGLAVLFTGRRRVPREPLP
ncbi:MAG: DMT family transporter [Actinomycetales bacterium]|nr:DMT family transporter [Actinomycetales bacterium]